MIIDIKQLGKNFGKFKALEAVEFGIDKGEIFGILGLNGAGKTTLIRCLVRFLRPEKGGIYFNGNTLTDNDIHRYFGYLPEDFQPPLNLTAFEFLDFLRSSQRSTISVESCLEWVGLSQDRKKRIHAYSRGMIQRLGLALALIKGPQVLVLDEPILGLDLAGQRQIFSLLKALNQQGKTIILSTHIFPHIENFCHRVGIIHKGTLRFTGKVGELLSRQKAGSLEEAFLKEAGLSSDGRNGGGDGHEE
ncbi:MAG: ATP-binding cassette domain-containing protein [Candidatus Omnitrophota bacterium]|jgi:ABC-2 type transport system ATP-binding protein